MATPDPPEQTPQRPARTPVPVTPSPTPRPVSSSPPSDPAVQGIKVLPLSISL